MFSFLKALGLALIITLAFQLQANSSASAQEFFGGRGISGTTNSNTPSFSNPLGTQFDTQTTNPIAGLFKKPAFLENLKSSGSGFLSGLPKLSNLVPQRDPSQPSFLGKMKSKTDAFFSKALAFEKLLPGRQQAAKEDADWSDVRQSMEDILATRAAEAARQGTTQTANALGGTLQR